MGRDFKNIFVKSKIYNNYIFMEVRNKGEKPFLLLISEDAFRIHAQEYFYVYNFDTDKLFIYKWVVNTFSNAKKVLKDYVAYDWERLEKVYNGEDSDGIWKSFELLTEANDKVKNELLTMYNLLLQRDKKKRKYKETLPGIVFSIFPDIFNFEIKDTSFERVKNVKANDYVEFILKRLGGIVEISIPIFNNKISLTFQKTTSLANILETGGAYTVKILSNKEIKFGSNIIKVKDENLIRFFKFINDLKTNSFFRILKILHNNMNYLVNIESMGIMMDEAKEIFSTDNRRVRDMYWNYANLEMMLNSLFRVGSETVINKLENISLALRGEAIERYRNRLKEFLNGDYRKIDIVGFLDAEKFQEYYLPNMEKCYVVDDSNGDFKIEEDYDFLNF